MTDPCLCGDPYCPHCGNPEQAALADAVEDFFETLDKELEPLIDCEGDLEVFKAAGMAALKAHKKAKEEAIKEALNNQGFGYEQELESLRDQLDRALKK